MTYKSGRSLEQLVALLEGALASQQKVTIESPCRLRDNRTGALREHDVVITSEPGHHSLRVAIECRDRSRPVGVPQVEAFYQKCLDTGIGQAVMVSSTGFCKTAREKARSCGIRCLDLNQVSEVDWLALSGLAVFRSRIEHAALKFRIKEQGIARSRPYGVVDAHGRAVSDLQILTFVNHCLSGQALNRAAPGRWSLPIDIAVDGLFARILEGGELFEVIGIKGTVYYLTEVERESYRLMRYEEQGTGRTLAEAAMAEVRHGSSSGRLLFTLNENRNVTVTYVPTESKDAEPGRSTGRATH